jgi:hypothetical protein
MAEQKVGKLGRIADATSFPTMHPLGWRRCRHAARRGTSSSAVVVVVVVVGVVVIEDDVPSSTPLPSRVVDDVIVPQLAPRVVVYFFLEEFSSIFIIYRLL